MCAAFHFPQAKEKYKTRILIELLSQLQLIKFYDELILHICLCYTL